MSETPAPLFTGFCRRLLLIPLLALVLPAQAVVVDLNTDGVSDIWALKYGVTSFSPTADTDGDGITDASEAAAGTNPFSANSTVRIASMSRDENGQHFTFPTLLGKGYVLQKSPGLAPATWTAEGGIRKGTGADLAVTIPAAGATEFFYRVVVQDMDTDADGVNDWEEVTLGFDPTNAFSNGLSAANDLARITQALGSVNAVTVVTADSSAAEPASAGPATQTGAFEIRRTGNLNAVTVNYSVSGTAVAGVDYVGVSGSVTLGLGVNSATVVITPLADVLVESAESVLLTVTANAAYNVGVPATAALLIDDKGTASGNGVRARYWNNTDTTIPVFTNTTGATNGSTTPVLNRIESQINMTAAPIATNLNTTYFVTRFTGDVLPEFSQIYTFQGQVQRGGRLWVNGQLLFSSWSNSPAAGTYSGTIELQAGQRVPIVFEHMARSTAPTAILSWQSANQPLQVIPQNRLFAATPPQILSALELMVIKGSPMVNYQIVASGEPTGYSAANLPLNWTYNATTGVVSGPPTVAGSWPIVLTATNAQGSGSAILNLTVIETGGGITRDVWSGTYADVTALPLATAPTSSALVTALEGPLAPGGGDYGARLRGSITAPTTGIYKFWVTGSDGAELWISDDDEPVNLFRRARTAGPTAQREWASPNAGKSPLLLLQAGKRYAVEVRHADPGADGHVSVGWLKPGEGGADPANAVAATEVVPSYALSPYVAPTIISGQSTLFATSMTAQGGAVTSGYGSASLRLSADESQAVLTFTHANLTSPMTGQHIHAGTNGEIIFDIDTAPANADGSHTWHIVPVGAFSVADIRNMIKAGNTYINIHTVFWPAGEIKGFLKLQAASQTFTPPAVQTWSDPADGTNAESALNRNGASRFLVQSTFGASAAEITAVQSLGFEGWINDQIGKQPTYHYPYVFANRDQTGGTVFDGPLTFNAWWRASVTGPDQLRQRIAFALSEIFVVSESGPLDDRADTLSDYYDMLLEGAFGNFRTLLENVTLHPAMGRYLDMLRNDKPNPSTGRIPNENYAREIKQLFSIGLNRMHPDGSLILNSKGELIPTYDQDAIIGFSHVFTGWYYGYTGAYRTSFDAPENWTNPMREVPVRHFTGQKRLLNNVVLPGLPMLAGVPLDPNATHTAAQYDMPAYQALAGQELDASLDALFNHPNIAPFLCRQLIQRLVTSTPSRGYLYRVVQKFENNGSGVRGDMVAVIKAILLDYEARSATLLSQQGYGKLREPLARVTAVARAFPAPAEITGSYTQNGSLITVNTGAPHLYSAGQIVYLDFGTATGGDPGSPLDANYTVLATPAPTTTTFAVRTRSSESAVTYAQGGAIVRFSVTGNNDFGLITGENIYAEYLDGVPTPPTNGPDTVEYVSDDEMQVVIAAASAKRGTYAQTAASTTLTITSTAHGFVAGASLHINFLTPTASLPVSGLYTVAANPAPTANTYAITAAEAVTRNGIAIAIPAADVLPTVTGAAVVSRTAEAASRSGPLGVTYSDWTMDYTDTDLGQTPLNSPTVFNFFLPDYQFPGILGNAGLTTPEFEITSETTVIRQSNFLYSGIFNDGLGQLGLSSFKGGNREIMVDLRPWMGTGPGGKAWAHNDNLDALIDELNTLLMGGQLPSSGTNTYGTPRVIVNAKDAIRNYVVTLPPLTPVAQPVVSLTGVGNPCEIRVTGHGLTTGDTVTISGITGGTFSPAINGTFPVTVTSSNRFTVPVNCSSIAGLNVAGATIIAIPAPPTATQLRDRVRAVVHLLITSPDFTTQK